MIPHYSLSIAFCRAFGKGAKVAGAGKNTENKNSLHQGKGYAII